MHRIAIYPQELSTTVNNFFPIVCAARSRAPRRRKRRGKTHGNAHGALALQLHLFDEKRRKNVHLLRLSRRRQRRQKTLHRLPREDLLRHPQRLSLQFGTSDDHPVPPHDRPEQLHARGVAGVPRPDRPFDREPESRLPSRRLQRRHQPRRGRRRGDRHARALHCHVVPRWNGDSNFMGAIGDTKVVPISLEETWERVRASWR